MTTQRVFISELVELGRKQAQGFAGMPGALCVFSNLLTRMCHFKVFLIVF